MSNDEFTADEKIGMIVGLVELLGKAQKTAKISGFGLLVVSPTGAVRHVDPADWGAEELVPDDWPKETLKPLQ